MEVSVPQRGARRTSHTSVLKGHAVLRIRNLEIRDIHAGAH